MLQLIIDRKQSDITKAKKLIEKAKKIENLTPSELSEYLAGLKGCYNISDLNRVESAVKYISDLLNSYGYSNIVDTKTWADGDFFTPTHIARYLNNLDILKNAYFVDPKIPATPTSYKSIQQANDIEKILSNIEKIIIGMEQSFIHCGVSICGQNRLWQQRFRRT